MIGINVSITMKDFAMQLVSGIAGIGSFYLSASVTAFTQRQAAHE